MRATAGSDERMRAPFLGRARCASTSSLVALVVLLAGAAGCAEQRPGPVTEGTDTRLTLLHTSDIHSRLLPFRKTVLSSEEDLGLLQDNEPFGGVARVSHVLERERDRAPRSIYLDSGDCYQGAPIFNAFEGEVEQRAMSLLRPDAVVIGNHEFDLGLRKYTEELQKWATYPLVAANYLFEPEEPLGDLSHPVEIVNADGLTIGVIGVANFSSLSSITEIGGSLNLVPLQIEEVVQKWIDILEPQVDLIVAVSHAGLSEDEEMIRHTKGLDVVLGGHLHVVLDPPKVVEDAGGRDVILMHSGAFAQFVGRLDVVVRDGEIVAHDHELFPIDETVPKDPKMVDLLAPYRRQLHQMIDLDSVYGYASRVLRRFDFDGGDSPLGNFVAEAIRQYAFADFGMTNSLGIRSDINTGPVTQNNLYNVFPFNNRVTTMYLSGADVRQLLDFATRRSAGRGCDAQIQVSGVEFTMNCSADPPVAEDIVFTDCGDPAASQEDCDRRPLREEAVYRMATNDYIAHGGSGFSILQVNSTRVDLDVALRDAVLEKILRSPRCIEDCRGEDGRLDLDGCRTYRSCVDDLSEFYGDVCRRVSETTPDTSEMVSYCSRDLGSSCGSTAACRTLTDCAEASCTRCKSYADCGSEQTCIDGWCRPLDVACRDGRCRRTCEADADCPGHELLGEPGRALCVDGLCHPRAGAPCELDADCVDPEAACADGGCPSCEDVSDCASGQRCVGGRCVTPVAVCVDHRCRLRCDGEGGTCLPGEVCTAEGHCEPRSCQVPADRGTACRRWAEWRALERCLEVPCPRSSSDGRIDRILPDNLQDLPFDPDIDDDR